MPQNAIPKVVTSVTGQRDRHPLTISDLQIPMGNPVIQDLPAAADKKVADKNNMVQGLVGRHFLSKYPSS